MSHCSEIVRARDAGVRAAQAHQHLNDIGIDWSAFRPRPYPVADDLDAVHGVRRSMLAAYLPPKPSDASE